MNSTKYMLFEIIPLWFRAASCVRDRSIKPQTLVYSTGTIRSILAHRQTVVVAPAAMDPLDEGVDVRQEIASAESIVDSGGEPTNDTVVAVAVSFVCATREFSPRAFRLRSHEPESEAEARERFLIPDRITHTAGRYPHRTLSHDYWRDLACKA